MIRSLVKRFLAAAVVTFALAGTAQQASAQAQYTGDQLVAAGNTFFTQLSGNLAAVIEEAISRFGLPNGYILGQTVGGAFIGGVGMTVLTNAGITVVPIVSGLGARLGFNIGYLKFTPTRTVNPF